MIPQIKRILYTMYNKKAMNMFVWLNKNCREMLPGQTQLK
jgi:hypothetical protein